MAESYDSYEAWLANRPESVQKLAAEFPRGSRFQLPNGEILYLIGYTEGDGLLCSPINPFEDYEGAIRTKVVAHAQCVRDKMKEKANG